MRLPKKMRFFYQFLSNYEKDLQHNSETAPTYIQAMHEAGAREAVRCVREEYERRFGKNLVCLFPQKNN